MKEIKLTGGMFAQVDDADFEMLNKRVWHVKKHRNTCYARTNITLHDGKRYKPTMHRLIMLAGAPEMVVDHIDRNGLNNQRANLRWVTRSENARNCQLYANNSSGFRGVYWNKRTLKWHASISVNGKIMFLGGFTDKRDAAIAYNTAAKQLFGEFANLNAVGA